MRRVPFAAFVSAVLFVLAVRPVVADDDLLRIRIGPFDEIDWQTRTVRSYGEAAPGGQGREAGIRQARARASDSMLALMRKVRVDDSVTLGSRMESDPDVAAQVGSAVDSQVVSRFSNRSDGSITVRLELDLLETVAGLVAPRFGGGRPLVSLACPTCGQHWPAGHPLPNGLELTTATQGAEAATGLIVRADNLRFEPALFPRLVNADGAEIYGPAFADAEHVHRAGLVSYVTVGDPAIERRVGARPLVIHPLGVRAGCDFVLSAEDVRRIHGNSLTLDALRAARVVIVTSADHVQ